MQNTLKNIGMSITLSVALFLSSCTEQVKETPKDEKFELTDAVLERLQIDTVKGADNQTDINFSAKITANEEKMAKIYPMVSGQLQNVPAKLGDRVDKGQLLATMTSAEMAGFDKEAISSSAELRNAQHNLKLTEDLYNSGLASARELEQAKNELLVKQAEDKRSRSILNLNGGNKNGIYTLRSPLSGFIIEKNVTSNMQVRPDNNQNLFTVADLSDVWALINIYESDISKVKEGDEVNISILSYPDKPFKGRISKIYNMLDNDSKVMNARVLINNPGYLLKPGMMASVQINTKNGTSLPSVNANCLIFDNNKYFVLVLDKVKKIRIQEIELGRKFEDKTYVSKGLNAGDRVVASKQLFLYDSLKP
ncbi:efflux RND transporter periplasmic adaptor subunit [Pedobacter heparinus]|uniref:Efflux transporter, RND family, MFP subunit n=1 Tax=Pedobacter heparinus (strain ATCC 13125 / DSM 2366 / CIP 104194 / JCM 7457 / NBRC 12017 / NCIMB 9290 / NRRL B-14731 / HIM 762-3) TaxID=485917 RepID=C6XSZ6_PEDHD|nr:efflux RND transporter periplasmic adaptor subunit [Pedobacter heparinus]ACU03557.1 efflux transporter, RND family, MFP subunit [Pedobacter heparinus DSM 2366]